MKRILPIAFVLGEQAAFSLFNFMLMVWVVRSYSIEQAGVFALAWTLSFLIYSFAEALIFNPFCKLVSTKRFTVEYEVGVSFFSLLIFIIVSETLIFIASSMLVGVWRQALLLSLIISPGILLGYFLRRILITTTRIHSSFFLILGQSIIITTLIALYRGAESVEVVAYSWLTSIILSGASFYFGLIRRLYFMGLRSGLVESKMLWEYGKWNALALLPVSASNFAITPIVSISHGISAVAILRALQSLTSPLHQAQSAIYSYFLPRCKSIDTALTAPVFCFFLILAPFIFMFCFPGHVVSIIYGVDFEGAEFLPFFALAMLFESVTQFICFFIQVAGAYYLIPLIRVGGVIGFLIGVSLLLYLDGSVLKYGNLSIAIGCLLFGGVVVMRKWSF